MLRHYCKTENCRKYANLNQDGFCPVCQPPETTTNECIDNCGICQAEIKDDISKSIGCDGCGKWFHAECAGPTALIDLITEAIKHSPEKPLLGLLLWFCPDCATRPAQAYKIGESKCIHVPPPSMSGCASDELRKLCRKNRMVPCVKTTQTTFVSLALVAKDVAYIIQKCAVGMLSLDLMVNEVVTKVLLALIFILDFAISQ